MVSHRISQLDLRRRNAKLNAELRIAQSAMQLGLQGESISPQTINQLIHIFASVVNLHASLESKIDFKLQTNSAWRMTKNFMSI